MNRPEIIDIVDQQDKPIDAMEREKAFSEDVGYRRVAVAFLKDTSGKLCFLKRSTIVSSLPDHFALVGGCVQSGESYHEAIRREVKEEVNIEATEVKQLAVVRPEETSSSLFKGVFEITINQHKIPFCSQAFSTYVWLTPYEFHEQVRSCQLYPVLPDLPYMVKRFYHEK